MIALFVIVKVYLHSFFVIEFDFLMTELLAAESGRTVEVLTMFI